MLDYEGIQIYWTGHDGFRLIGTDNANMKKIIYIDPYKLTKSQQNRNDADILLISHNHFDHLSKNDIEQVVDTKTTVVAPQDCIEQLKGFDVQELKSAKPSEKLIVQNVPIEVVPAYNINKEFHPKSDGNVGYISIINNKRIYHAGDTDMIPEMKVTLPDIALVPVSGTYVMTAEEAATAVNEFIKPSKFAIPMHYGSIVGNEDDAKRFSELVNVCEIKILHQE